MVFVSILMDWLKQKSTMVFCLIEFFCCCCRVSTVWYVQYLLLINRYSTAVAGTVQSFPSHGVITALALY